jgi:hypothetical protein
MSNIQVFNPSANMPAHAKSAVLDAVSAALAGGGATGKRISIKGGVFRLFSGGKEITAIDDRFLDVVIVAAAPKVSRTFYGNAFVEGQNAAPTCWSANGDAPDAACKTAQAPTCASCPKNMKGSGQGDSRACSFNQRIAVVLANNVDGDVLQLTLPSQSIFGKGDGENRPLQEYARFYAAQNISVSKFVTRLRFDTQSATPKLFFKAMRWLSDEEYETTTDQGVSVEAIKAITMTVSQQDGVAPAVAAAAPLGIPGTPPKAAKAAPAPEPEAATPEDDEPPAAPPKAAKVAKAKPAPKEYDNGGEEPEPEVKKASAAPAKAAPAGGGLNAVLSAWDDE